MDLDLSQRPFPYKLVRLWLASCRRKLTPAERKELDRLLGSEHSGRRAQAASPRPPSRRCPRK